jgi:6-phospho-3-hexuloisomerase
MHDRLAKAVEEIAAAARGVDPAAVDDLCQRLAAAGRIVVYGCGREALQIRGFAMRLYHLGLEVSVVGEMTCPPVGAGDVFLATSGPGELATVLALMGEARKAGAVTAVLTAEAGGSAARAADHALLIPAQTMASDQGAAAPSLLPLGSVYEGALFLIFEIMVLKLRDLLDARPEDLRARHTNLE